MADYEKNSDFASGLNEIILERGKNVSEIAKATGVSTEAVRLWKTGSGSIRLSQLIKLADYFGCSIEYLIGRTLSSSVFPLSSCPPFYERLRFVMKEKGVTRYMLVKNTPIFDGYFTNWKRGADLNLHTLIILSDYLECTIDYLVGREG